MASCPACSGELPESCHYCPSCGAAIRSFSQVPTELDPRSGGSADRRPAPSSRVGRLAPSDSFAPGGFTPGAMFAGRYRIVGLVGRGGMGEVYRADDLKLGQPVALKLLPKAISQDPARRERFYGEVRMARQVSHPNVCRVYDIGEIDGQHYLSMEYVDGEDLASLLRRIGRLPHDKALEITRQLCAGLAAAHDKGVLHRDLKPANVMIDGRGRARITDFGLAVRADEAINGEEISGTPAYMAPEQLAGKAVSVRSDLYSLGLVLYELYTGKRALDATTLAEWKRKHTEEPPASPSSVTRDIDPAVERAILQCLEKDPLARPRSALAVAAALPGGDPLAAALAAGETPSPEMVAAAGETGALRPAVAWCYLASILIGILVIALLSAQTMLHRQVPLEKPPDVLADRAQEMVKRLGYSDRPIDSVHWFSWDDNYLGYVAKHESSPSRWERLASVQRGAILFFYRQSPRHLVPRNDSGTVKDDDPPTEISGMVNVVLDQRGRLAAFRAVPPQFDDSKGPWKDPDWSALFAEAGLNLASFRPTDPKWAPPVASDSRAAWDGIYPDQPEIPFHVEAAAYHGKPVWFELQGPWERPVHMVPLEETAFRKAAGATWSILLLSWTIGGVILARRNMRLGRGDRRGAFKLVAYVFLVEMLGWLFGADHVARGYEFDLLGTALKRAVFNGGVVWLIYMALEPLVRRRWPHILISWNRLLAGRFRDPLVGRDILIGGVFAIGAGLLLRLAHLLPRWLGLPASTPISTDSEGLRDARHLVSLFLHLLQESLLTLGLLFLVLLLHFVLRKQWLAVGGSVVFLTLMSLEGGDLYVGLLLGGAWTVLVIFLLMRFGLVASVFGFIFYAAPIGLPMTLELSAWYAGRSLFTLLALGAIAAYGFHTALARRALFRGAEVATS